MDEVARRAYQQLLNTVEDVPPGISKLHDKFADIWVRLGNSRTTVPGHIMALIAILGKDDEPRCGDTVYVDGAKCKYISKLRGNSVRVKFPGDSKKFRVVNADRVKYE